MTIVVGIDPGHVALCMQPVLCEDGRTRIGALTPTRALTTITLSEAMMAARILPACSYCGKPCRENGRKFCSILCRNKSGSKVEPAILSSGLGVRDWLDRNYYPDGCNLASAAKLLGLEKRTLWAFLVREGLPTKPQSECQSGDLNPFYGLSHHDQTKAKISASSKERQPLLRRNETRQYGDGPPMRYESSPLFKHGGRRYRKRAIESFGTTCVRCGSTESIEVHHKDRNRKNNSPSNLEVLCRKCHRSEHRRDSRD